MDVSSHDPDMTAKNDGYKFALLIEDIFSRKAWAVPTRTTQTKEAWDAVKSVMAASKRKPRFAFWTDRGFLGDFKKEAAKLGLRVYHANGKHKSAYVERLVRTIRRMLQIELDAEGRTRKWLEPLQTVMASYNRRRHRALGMSPDQASKLSAAEQAQLWTHLYGRIEPNIQQTLQVGEWCRISLLRDQFDHKEYNEQWSRQVYEVVGVSPGAPPLFTIKEWGQQEPLEGRFYKAELMKTAAPAMQFWEISKILKRSGNQILVQWLGTNKTSWINKNSTQ